MIWIVQFVKYFLLYTYENTLLLHFVALFLLKCWVFKNMKFSMQFNLLGSTSTKQDCFFLFYKEEYILVCSRTHDNTL